MNKSIFELERQRDVLVKKIEELQLLEKKLFAYEKEIRPRQFEIFKKQHKFVYKILCETSCMDGPSWSKQYGAFTSQEEANKYIKEDAITSVHGGLIAVQKYSIISVESVESDMAILDRPPKMD